LSFWEHVHDVLNQDITRLICASSFIGIVHHGQQLPLGAAAVRHRGRRLKLTNFLASHDCSVDVRACPQDAPTVSAMHSRAPPFGTRKGKLS
jgi:hypothetical protein